MSAPRKITYVLRDGETFDLAIDAQAPESFVGDPREDGSRLRCFFKREPPPGETGETEAVLAFDGPNGPDASPRLTIESWDQEGRLARIAFRAARQAVAQIPEGDYVGCVMHERPRPDDPLGPQYAVVATIKLQKKWGSTP